MVTVFSCICGQQLEAGQMRCADCQIKYDAECNRAWSEWEQDTNLYPAQASTEREPIRQQSVRGIGRSKRQNKQERE